MYHLPPLDSCSWFHRSIFLELGCWTGTLLPDMWGERGKGYLKYKWQISAEHGIGWGIFVGAARVLVALCPGHCLPTWIEPVCHNPSGREQGLLEIRILEMLWHKGVNDRGTDELPGKTAGRRKQRGRFIYRVHFPDHHLQ